ncbi:MAG: TonB-dependent receptor domain-containing protein, partial [Acidobacteriaceae bacterium]
MRKLIYGLFIFLLCAGAAYAQTASLTGSITDPSGAVVPNASVDIVNQDTGVALHGQSNGAGLYVIPFVKPGVYNIKVQDTGFKTLNRTGVTLNVAQNARMDFALQVGSETQNVKVTAGSLEMNTTDASVSTVVDRHFVENLPLNGRSFQALLYMTPGVTTNAGSAATNDGGTGGFVVNGQRGNENYWLIDGVSGNIQMEEGSPGPSGGGAAGATNIVGGTMALVSVDDLSEFRIVTSTFAPEFGRSMGGQIDIETRSGTNQFHGNVFEYLRNTVFDANNWFNDYYSQPKAAEIQNDFGGVVGGPILKDKAFFFFSDEYLRLIQPGALTATTPDAASRAATIPAMQPYINMFPLPPAGATDTTPGSGIVLYSKSYSIPEKARATSLRVDYQASKKLSLFARYNDAPSSATFVQSQINDLAIEADATKTATAGLTWIPSSSVVDQLRLNYSVSGGNSSSLVTNADGGAPPPAPTFFPSPYNFSNANLYEEGAFGVGMTETNGDFAKNYQRQWNFVDSASVVKGNHYLKFGIDYRRLIPNYGQATYWSIPIFLDMSEFETGTPFLLVNSFYAPGRFRLQNLGAYGQDTWRVNPRLTMTYGLRWDVDFSPETIESTPLPGITGFSLTSLANLAYAPPGTPPYTTHYGNVAPRIGAAYMLRTTPGREVVLRAGWGIFYGLADSELLNLEAAEEPLYPYGVDVYVFGPSYPPTPEQAATPVNEQPNKTNGYPLYGIQPDMNLPWAQEFNVSLQQSLGTNQSFTLSYVGAFDRRLEEAEATDKPNPNYAEAWIVDETGSSSYNALQVVYHRQLSHGFQALIDYTWSHAIDDGSYGNWLTFIYPGETSANVNENRGDADYDIPQAFSAALTYQPPAVKSNLFLKAITSGWATNNIVSIQSGPPGNVITGDFAGQSSEVGAAAQIRPDQVPG